MRYVLPLLAIACSATSLLMLTYQALADPRTDCPEVGKQCKVLVLTEGEQGVLLNEKGILSTAAAARSLDLGNLVTYFQQKIANAPAGDVQKAPEKPAEIQGNPALGAGPQNPASK